MKTGLDVVNRAFRRLGVKAEDEALTADQIANGTEALETLVAELDARALTAYVSPLALSATDVSEEYFLPLVNILAAELAPEYSAQAPMTREAAILRLFSVMFPDDRDAAEAVYY